MSEAQSKLMSQTIVLNCKDCGRALEGNPMPYCPSCSHREKEANYFACCLLMPEGLVRKWLLAHIRFEITDDDMLEQIAKDFHVSMTLAAIRLFQLGVFTR